MEHLVIIVIAVFMTGFCVGRFTKKSPAVESIREEEPTTAPVPAPISCLVLGILKSMADEPDAWKKRPFDKPMRGYWVDEITHTTSAIGIVIVSGFSKINFTLWHSATIENRDVRDDEAKAIYEAWDKIRDARIKTARAAADAESQPRLNRFIELGCPASQEAK